VQVAPEEPTAEEKSPQPVYYVATIDDTVWGICRRHDITQAQFWQWNGYLWDEMGMPRDTLYLQEGWRLRVG
jgi:transposase-like protein